MLGFICALDIEVEGIKNMMTDKAERTVAKITYTSGKIFGRDAVCCECGMGKVNAAMSTQIMIDLYHPEVIINSGVAGSLSGKIKIGDLVISDDCVQHDMDTTEMGSPLGEVWFNDGKRVFFPADKDVADRLERACEAVPESTLFRGRVASGDVFVSKKEHRARIADAFGALACEMEGSAVGTVCYRNDVPFAILRCISDDYNGESFVDYMIFREEAAEKTRKVIKSFISGYGEG